MIWDIILKKTLPITMGALGDFYANLYEYGYAGNTCPEEEEVVQLLEAADITTTQLCSLGERVEGEITKAEIFLKV